MKKQNLDQRTSGKGKGEKKKTWLMLRSSKGGNNVIRGAMSSGPQLRRRNKRGLAVFTSSIQQGTESLYGEGFSGSPLKLKRAIQLGENYDVSPFSPTSQRLNGWQTIDAYAGTIFAD